MIQLPSDFSRRVLATHGERGATWINRLPAVLDNLATRWGLTLFEPFPGMAYNFVVPAQRSDGTQAVLKVGVTTGELEKEIAALQAFDGHGAVRLLEALPKQGVCLLERLRPGVPASDISNDRSATMIAIQVIRQLRECGPYPAAFPTTADWAAGFRRLRQRFAGATGPFPEPIIQAAERIYAELLASSDPPILLHGDLHHGNILSAGEDEWLAIDPHGVIGEQAYEAGAWLRNPFPQILEHPDPQRLIAGRVALLADGLGHERERLLMWGVAQAVLSAWWSYEDNEGNWPGWIAVARLISGAARPLGLGGSWTSDLER